MVNMIIFVNGSINAGKSTVGKQLAEKLQFTFVEFDDIRHALDEPDIDKAVPIVFDKGIKLLNEMTANGESVVVAYPLGAHNYERLKKELTDELVVITLAPQMDVALSDRGARRLNDKQRLRIRHHYAIGIPSPSFGFIVDNSDLTVPETLDCIMNIIA
jgi:shikimate kinase